jgi:hypothetical protein
VRIGAWRAAGTLLALALSAPAVAHAGVPWPNDPQFVASGGANAGWVRQIHWTPPPADPDIGWPTIAVVDSGLFAGLDDFAGYLDDESADCVGAARARPITNPTQVDDAIGHGTRVATIAAAPANGKGTVGVSPNSPLIVVRITPDNVNFNPACAFRYLAGIARSGQLLVVNVSSTMAPLPDARSALDELIRAGALVVAASGNFKGNAGWPASASHVLAVGRGDRDANVGNSAGGSHLDLVAPGNGLTLFDVRDQKWHTNDQAGTSFAAPMVAGVAARVWGTFGDVVDPQVIAYLLRKTASRNGKFSPRQGFGMVNLLKATQFAPSKVPQSDEMEPNDTKRTATKSVQCRTACRLHGLVSSTDDTVDYWRLARRRCPRGKIRALNHARVDPGCFPYHGRAMIVVKARKNSFAAYTLVVPRR